LKTGPHINGRCSSLTYISQVYVHSTSAEKLDILNLTLVDVNKNGYEVTLPNIFYRLYLYSQQQSTHDPISEAFEKQN